MLLLKFIKKFSFIAGIVALSLALPTNVLAKNCSKKTLSLKSAETMALSSLLSELGRQCSFTVMIKDQTAKSLVDSTSIPGINLENKTIYQIIKSLIGGLDVFYNFKGNTLDIWGLETKTFKVDYITSSREGTAVITASSEQQTREFDGEGNNNENDNENADKITSTENFNFWKTINEEIMALLDSGDEAYRPKEPIINTHAGIITITATKAQIRRIDQYVKELQKRLHKQVLIDVSIISVELSHSNNEGINWSKFQLGINQKQNADGSWKSTGGASTTFLNTLDTSAKNLSIINNLNFSMEGLLNFVQSRGNAKVISSPKVMTLNNQQALITVGNTINYSLTETTRGADTGATVGTSQTNYSTFVGVLLNLLPEISEDNKIMLRINPSISNLIDRSLLTTQPDGGLQYAPNTLDKKLSTVVRVNDGDTIILGGLISQDRGINNTSVPLLSDVPVVGRAFRSKSDNVINTELVFVITPHIVNLDKKENYKATLRDLGYSSSIYE